MGGGKKAKSSGKVRFDGVDVSAAVSQLKGSLLGRRIINIYDGVSEGNDAYLFKLDGDDKPVLFLESGVRFHTTVHQSSLQQDGMPSPFCSKMRKHLRGKRLERVVQLGNLDRVVEFTFGTGDLRHSLIMELYARGNILLTNNKYEILSLLRSHEYAEQDVQVRVGNVYPVTYATSLGQTETLKDENDSSAADSGGAGLLGMDESGALNWAMSQIATKQDPAIENSDGKKTNKKAKTLLPLKALLLKPTSGVYHFGPSLLEHCILCSGLDPNLKLSEATLSESMPADAWRKLIDSLAEEGQRVLEQLAVQSVGYILYSRRDSTEAENGKQSENLPQQHSDKILEEFQPHLLKQHEGKLYIQFDTFLAAVDDFFAHIGGQKRALRAEAAEAAAQEKLVKIRKDQERRVETLLQEQEKLKDHATLVKYHADDVDKALSVINSALDSGMDWEALEQLVLVEQQNENPIALLIKKLDLEKDSLVLSLPDFESEDGEGNTVDVVVSLKESAFGNVRDMFDKYRAAKDKSEKTIEASEKALKAAEATAHRQLAEAQKKSKNAKTLAPQRKTHWFEKFHWFITSDNYLVLGGRDAQQNELLVKRYLRPGDAYLHADVHGAASCVLRAKRRRVGTGGKTKVLPLSEQALREAGNFTICFSSAWSSRMVTSAWWVEPSQVSKTAPTGEYLTVGSFMIRGRKNFLPPTQLEMGLAVLFRLGDDDSIARHENERRDFALLDTDFEAVDQELEEIQEQSQGTGHDETVNVSTADLEASDDILPSKESGEAGPNETTKDSANEDDAPEGSRNENVTAEPNDVSPVPDANSTNGIPLTAKSKKKGLSVRDRKLIKRYGSLEAAEKAALEREKRENRLGKEKEVKKSKSTSAEKPQTQHKRGKKSKLKRAAKKYDDQDDEDRELAMLALHGGEKDEKKKKNGIGRSATQSVSQLKASEEAAALLVKDSSEVAKGLPENVQKILAECVSVKDPNSDEVKVRWEKFDADVIDLLIKLDSEDQQLAAANRLLRLRQSSRIDNFSSSLAGIVRTIKKYGHEGLDASDNDKDAIGGARRKTKAEKEKEKEAWREALAEEGIVEGGTEEEMIDDTAELSKLTGKPHPDDALLYAVPVCAPYQTLSQYKYKVKLTPGAQKKGKASKQCLEFFLKADSDRSSVKERDLIKSVGDNPWVQAICPNVMISAAGASKAAKKQKGAKKKKK